LEDIPSQTIPAEQYVQVLLSMYLRCNLRTAMYYDTTIKSETGPPFLPPMTLELRSACLLGRCLRHLHKIPAGTNVTHCRPGGGGVGGGAGAAAAVRILTEVRSHVLTRALDTGISWHKQQFDDSQSVKTLFIF